MGKKQTHNEKGDTLVEVLLVTAILSMIVVGANLLMNRAFGGTQAALEHTLVRQSIEGQVEMLTFARDQAIASPGSPAANVWTNEILPLADGSVSPYGSCLTGGDPRRFYLEMDGGTTLDATTGPAAANGIAQAGRGVWVEAYRPSPSTNYIDFHVYGCWEAPISGPNLTTGTVVRLYVP